MEVSKHTEGIKEKTTRPNGLPESLIRYDGNNSAFPRIGTPIAFSYNISYCNDICLLCTPSVPHICMGIFYLGRPRISVNRLKWNDSLSKMTLLPS